MILVERDQAIFCGVKKERDGGGCVIRGCGGLINYRGLFGPAEHVLFTDGTVNRPDFCGRFEQEVVVVEEREWIQPGCPADREFKRQTSNCQTPGVGYICGNFFRFLCSVKFTPSFSFARHDHHGRRRCGFVAGSTGCIDPRCAHKRSHTRFVDQERRHGGRDTDNNCADRRSGMPG